MTYKNPLQLTVVFFAVACLISCDSRQGVTLTNPSGDALPDQPVIIKRSQLDELDGKVPVIKKDGDILPVQYDDLDGDGQWDEMALQYSFAPGESFSGTVHYMELEKLPDFSSRANVYLGVSPNRDNNFGSVTEAVRPEDHEAMSTPYLYQYEGPGWESDLVAFRSYFDSRNGKDIFGKTSPRLYVDSIGLGENYHELQPWGLDVLKVGASLGAGSLALLKNDSIYRLGDTREARFEIIADGPVRAIFKLTYGGWEVAGEEYGLEETITIWGGKRWYESQVKLTGIQPGATPGDTLVTGIVDLKDVPKHEVDVPGWKILYSHGKQSENKDYLGMGILVPEAHLAGFGEAPVEGEGVLSTYTAYLVPQDGSYRFLFYAGWEGENPQFTDQEYFEKQLLAEAGQLNQTVNFKLNKQ